MPVVPSSPPGGAADDVEAAPERARRVAVPPASAVVRRGRSAKRPKADDDRAEEVELWGGGSSSERSTERSVIGRAESEAGRAAREEAVAAGVGLGLFEPVRSIWLPTNGFWSASSLLVAFAVTVLCRAVEGDEGLWPVARQAAIAFCVGWSAQLIVLVAGRKLEERVCALPADVCEDRRAMPLLALSAPAGFLAAFVTAVECAAALSSAGLLWRGTIRRVTVLQGDPLSTSTGAVDAAHMGGPLGSTQALPESPKAAAGPQLTAGFPEAAEYAAQHGLTFIGPGPETGIARGVRMGVKLTLPDEEPGAGLSEVAPVQAKTVGYPEAAAYAAREGLTFIGPGPK